MCICINISLINVSLRNNLATHTPKQMRKLNLDDLKKGQPGISPDFARVMVEATALCFVKNGHQSGTVITITGEYEEKLQVFWSNIIDEQIERTWGDLREAVEFGATAMGVLLAMMYEGLETYQRIPQEGEADYILRNIKTREVTTMLEVSGIFAKSETNTTGIRVNIKRNRIEKRELENDFPILIVVTEFSKPESKMIKI